MHHKHIKYIIIGFLITILPFGYISCSSGDSGDSDISHYTCAMHPTIHMDAPGQCPICGMDLIPVKKEVPTAKVPAKKTYTCAMHPKIKMDNPGQCPICGMDLVLRKVDEASSSSGKGIRIDPTYTNNIGVTTEKVQVRDLIKTINTYGKVAHDSKLWVAQNEYIQAIKLGDKSLIRSAELKLEYMGLSKEWVKLLKQRRRADLGLHIESNEALSLFEAYVYQEDIGSIHIGQETAILDQRGRFLDTGTVKAINTMANLSTRSVRVLIEAKKNLKLKLNTFVQFKIKFPLGKKLSVSKSAILFNGDHNMVYVTRKKGYYEPVTIDLGEQAGPYLVVLAGLKEGDEVVTNGTFLIDSETQIKMGGKAKNICEKGESWNASMSMCMPDT